MNRNTTTDFDTHITPNQTDSGFASRLTVGDWIEVRSKAEILATLDPNGQLDGMPFMPEMLDFCGQRFQVHKRAHKTCDTVFPVRGRRVHQAVHLTTRCSGQAHGGCQAGCLLFWKESWLRPVNGKLSFNNAAPITAPTVLDPMQTGVITESDLLANATLREARDGEPVYVCQATRLPYASKNLAWWDVRQYIEDYKSGNSKLWTIVKGVVFSIYYHLSQAGIGLGRPMRWLYDKSHPLWHGTLFPRKTGSIPRGQPTPTESLELQPGELVRVKSHTEILKTLNTASTNRGLYWDAEMVPYCGGTYRVLKRVTQIIDEKTGIMVKMKGACIILDTVVCQARYSPCRMFCPRGIYQYWREIWLERVPSNSIRANPSEDRLDV